MGSIISTAACACTQQQLLITSSCQWCSKGQQNWTQGCRERQRQASREQPTSSPLGSAPPRTISCCSMRLTRHVLS